MKIIVFDFLTVKKTHKIMQATIFELQINIYMTV